MHEKYANVTSYFTNQTQFVQAVSKYSFSFYSLYSHYVKEGAEEPWLVIYWSYQYEQTFSI